VIVLSDAVIKSCDVLRSGYVNKPVERLKYEVGCGLSKRKANSCVNRTEGSLEKALNGEIMLLGRDFSIRSATQ
jgi:hypothetical protein